MATLTRPSEPIDAGIEDSFMALMGAPAAAGVTTTVRRELAIDAKGLTKRFGSFTAVDHITFDVGAGEVFGFLGANGAGKTTAIKILVGLLEPTEGDARVAGFDVRTERHKIRRNIGYMSQRFSLYADLTVRENIQLYGGIYGLTDTQIRDRTEVLLESLGLTSSAGDLVGSLPLGWKQKLAFSVALLHEPKIVFLDEPTGGVDPITRRQVLGADLPGGRARHDGVRHDALHG
jgi:ABC-2 type transport system ATP-binding protein